MAAAAAQAGKRPARRRRRATIAITAEEDRALRWRAKKLGLRNLKRRGKFLTGVQLRDTSLVQILTEYRNEVNGA